MLIQLLDERCGLARREMWAGLAVLSSTV